jgi:ergothioneine biosynthesis protein EgtB
MNRLVTHGEWLEFVQAGGYQDARWWLSAGWDWVCAQGIQAPLYWQQDADGAEHDGWSNFTLHGRVPIDPHTPIVHISYFEADAYARWRSATDTSCAGARLPTEAEWEAAALPDEGEHIAQGNFVDSRALHPMPVAKPHDGLMQMMGDVWQWTSSSYSAYPGFAPWDGAVGEYNGKFMVNQYILRGGSCATPRNHIRASYRNFFPTDVRWQFMGLRLAKSL